MPRAMWSGAISFGLVSVPVKLYTAVSRKSIRFNQIDSETNSRIKQKRVNSAGDEVPFERIVKGYEIAKDSYVILSEEELSSFAPKASRTIEISGFVSGADIDPIFYDSAYHLVPDELARKPYALLLKAMEEKDMVAMATVVMRTKQYLVAIRPRNSRLMMSTMVFADELVAASDLPGVDDEVFDLSDAELSMASQLIDSLSTVFDPEEYRDSYREKLLELIESKAAGELQSIAGVDDSEDAAVVDLMAALEASVNAAKAAQASEAEDDAQSA